MVVAFVPCSAKKLDQPAPAWLLYLPSPSFRTLFEAAAAVADRVFILSGKHGVLSPSEIIAPYDAHVKDADDALISETRQRTRHLWECFGGGAPALFYGSTEYSKLLGDFPREAMAVGSLFERMADVPKASGAAKGSTLPIVKVLAWAYFNRGRSLDDLRDWLGSAYSHPATQKLQYQRIINSGYFDTSRGRLEYIGHPCDKE